MLFDISPTHWGRGGVSFAIGSGIFISLFIRDELLLPQKFSPSEWWLSMDPFVAVAMCRLLLLSHSLLQ